MKHLLTILSFFLVIAISCQDKEKMQSGGFKPYDMVNFPVVIDTAVFDSTRTIREERNATWLSTVRYDFFYIGSPRDTLLIRSFPSSIPPPPPKTGLEDTNYKKIAEYIDPVKDYYIDWQDKRDFKFWDDANLDIKFDTNSLMNGSYPVLVANSDEDTVYVGYGAFNAIMPLIMEAKDSTGSWKAIEKSFVYACGNGVSSVILPPNEVALTFVQSYQGNYNTEFRLSMGKSKSPTFKGTMNYRQFENIFDKHGDYKEEYKSENNMK